MENYINIPTGNSRRSNKNKVNSPMLAGDLFLPGGCFENALTDAFLLHCCKKGRFRLESSFFEFAKRTRMVGVTRGCKATSIEPARPTAVAWSKRAQSTALLPFLPALGGKTSKKRRTVAFFHRFPLVPK